MTQLQKDNIKRQAIYAKELFKKIVQDIIDINNSRSAMDVITGKQFARLAGTGINNIAPSSSGMVGVLATVPVIDDV